MNQLLKFTCYLLLLSVLIACKSKTATPHTSTSTTSTPLNQKKTQALLLKQSFEFDPNDKNKVTGDYAPQEKVSIPTTLMGPCKWILFEGPVLENDIIAYRYYSDQRHRFDIYGKRVTDLVMDTVSWQYHDVMDWGSDILKVGNSLGIGSPAIWYQDSLYTYSKFAKNEIEIIENGNNQSTIKTVITDLNIAGHLLDIVQLWTIKAGEPSTTIQLKITKGQLPPTAYFATGIVKHIESLQTDATENHFYAYTWGKQSYHKDYLGMAIFADQKWKPEKIADDLSHAFIFKNATDTVSYAFLAAWEQGNSGVKTEEDFKKTLKKFIN